MNVKEEYKNILAAYLPEQVLDQAADWIIKYNFDLRITKSRSTKLGDYHSPLNGNRHKISLNHNLNKYSFFITLVHEVAHLINWEKHKAKVKPHGQEWKEEFKNLLYPFLQTNLFPQEIKRALEQHLAAPTASSCTDINLLRVLQAQDTKKKSVLLEELPVNSIFKTSNKKYFIKGERIKKRIRCQEVKSKTFYLFHPLAEVFTIKQELF